jgi:hypothetical protein
MTLEVTKTVLNKIILNVWIENGPILTYDPGIELAFRSNSYIYVHYCLFHFKTSIVLLCEREFRSNE